MLAIVLPVAAQEKQREPFIEFVRERDASVSANIEVDATQAARYSIPPTMFGTFTENIWDAVYGGVWAQVLHNPSFEPDYLSAGNMTDAVRFSRLVTDPSFGSGFVRVEPLVEPVTNEDRNRFARSSSLGLPIPWEALRASGVRYEPRDGDAPNSYRALLLMGLAGREVGIRQGVYLPVHRTLNYEGTLWAKIVSRNSPLTSEGAPLVNVSLRRRDKPDEIIAQIVINEASPVPHSSLVSSSSTSIADSKNIPDYGFDGGGVWRKYNFVLVVPKGKIESLEKIDFCLAVDDERRVMLDDVRLFPGDNIERFDPEIIAQARLLRTPLLRFGGNFVSGYHWLDGVGDIDKRRTMLNQAWGLPEYNHFGTDEFLALCRLIGAEPQISVNAGSGTSKEAAAWVEYCNGSNNTKYGRMRAANGHAAPYNVKYWEVGNELWGDFQIGWQTASSNARRYNEFAAAMRAVDSNISLIATGADVDFYREWNGELIKQAGGGFDFVSTHLVIGMQPGEQLRPNADDDFTHRADFAVPVGVGRKLDEMQAQLQADARNADAKFAFTEWQFWSPRPQDPRFTNLGGAINAAAFFNMLMRRADFVPISNMSNLVQFAGIHRQRGRTFVTPSYHVLKLYSDTVGWSPLSLRLQSSAYDVREGNRRLPDISNVPDVDTVALLSPDKQAVRVYLVNRNLSREITARIAVRDFPFAESVDLQSLNANDISVANTPENPNAITVKRGVIKRAGDSINVSLPAHSLTVIELTQARN